MEKDWTSSVKGEDKLILITGEKIYKANPKGEVNSKYIHEVKSEKKPKGSFGIPFSYINEIQLREGKKIIQIFFGQESEEHLRIKSEDKKKEIFEYLKDNIPNTKYDFEKLSEIKAAKKPLIALAAVLAIFLWVLSYSVQYDAGYEFIDNSNGRYIKIILAIASLGTLKASLIFGSLASIALIKVIKEMKNTPAIHKITRKQ